MELSPFESARIKLGEYVPALRDIPLETLTTNLESGLAVLFRDFAAIMRDHDELAYPTSYLRDEGKQDMHHKLRRRAIVEQLSRYSYSREGDTVVIRCDGRVYLDHV